jgi:hypothetical protein
MADVGTATITVDHALLCEPQAAWSQGGEAEQ